MGDIGGWETLVQLRGLKSVWYQSKGYFDFLSTFLRSAEVVGYLKRGVG